MDQFDVYLKKAKRSVFRFEGLQDYSAEDGDDFVRKYLETKKLVFQPEESAWWRDIKAMNERGIKTARVRMVTEPMTDYTQAELAHLKALDVYSGERTRIIKEEAVQEIAMSLPDFYLIDNEFLFLMEYGPKGKYLGSTFVEGAEAKRYSDIAQNLVADSVPLL